MALLGMLHAGHLHTHTTPACVCICASGYTHLQDPLSSELALKSQEMAKDCFRFQPCAMNASPLGGDKTYTVFFFFLGDTQKEKDGEK